MFEGIVRQLLLGYLGRYIKDFEKQQLKITLEEVVLEDVELILEAFDHLQLPVALKRGHVGRLSIGIPWKKLGWEYPIVISLEDVLFFAGPRNDDEWSIDAVERRELAAKKAKLAAAELAKLSRRVCDNQAGQSLISHVTGRILDSIQLSMKNVHILYSDMPSQSVLFGLRFSSLTVAKQTIVGSVSSKARGDQVNKLVEIRGLGIHCTPLEGFLSSMDTASLGENELWQGAVADMDKYDYVVIPFDLSLQVTKSGKLELDAPQYSVTAELPKLVMSINPAQLWHILKFADNISTCQLREKYGRYRPWNSPLAKKLKGWQYVWWHYAQESVLSDVHKKLKKTSWRYLGQRLDHRRKYVNLYKVKLNFLLREQPVDPDLLYKLEQMEKDSDIEDILRFRSIAEQELEDTQCSVSSEAIEGINSAEKLPNPETSAGRARGWLNWLSRGVLGAGGTADSSQFSGVVSDEVIKDICEATKFQPMPSANSASSGVLHLFALNFHINKISLLMKSMNLGNEIANLTCSSTQIEFNIWEDSTDIIANVGSAEVINSSKQTAILRMKEEKSEANVLTNEEYPASIRFEISLKNQMEDLILTVAIQPIEVYYDLEFLLCFLEFYSILESHKSLQQRVLLSLNGIRNVKCRIQSKTECIMSRRQRVILEVNIVKLSICVPWENELLKECCLRLQVIGLQVSSNLNISPVVSRRKVQCQFMRNWLKLEDGSDILNSVQLDDIYDHYAGSMDNFQVTLIMPGLPRDLKVVEKFSASITISHCIIPDEMILKQLEAHFIVSLLHVHFSASIYAAFLSVVECLQLSSSNSRQVQKPNSLSSSMTSSYPTMPFCFSISANFELFKFEISLDDDRDNISVLLLSLQQLKLMFANCQVQDCWICTKEVKITSYQVQDESKSNIICSSRMPDVEDVLFSQAARSEDGVDFDWNESLDRCFLLHHVVHKNGHTNLYLRDIEFHCYPYIVQKLVGFCDKLMVCSSSGSNDISLHQTELKSTDIPTFSFQRFGISNFCESGFAEWESIPLHQYPFVGIHNSGRLRSLDSSITIPKWRNFEVKDKNIANSDIRKNLNTPSVTGLEAAENCMNSNILDMLLEVANVSIHFHDLSCVLGSITIPVGKASIVYYSDQFDMLFSVEGLTLLSNWWKCDFQEFLWEPSLPNRFSVLNIRIRKGNADQENSDLEISFSIQNVCCVLSPKYLAILIAYFTLPDWRSDDSKYQFPEKTEHVSENRGSIVYKFEVLDSIIISPVESKEEQLLKLDLEQFYCSFIDDDALKDESIVTFLKFSIAEDKVAERAHLNIFGRDLRLSLLTIKDFNSDTPHEKTGHGSCTLVQSCSADIWLRLSGESQASATGSPTPVCILAKILHCEVAVEDSNFVSGFVALAEVIDQYAVVDEQSRYFTCDIPGFLQSIQTVKDNSSGTPEDSSIVETEIRCCISSLCVNFVRKKGNLDSRDVVGRLELGFKLSITMRNATIMHSRAQFSTLLLTGSLNSIHLAKLLSDSTHAPVLDISLSATRKNKIELLIDIPSLEVWYHQSDWVMIFDHVYSCIPQSPRSAVLGTSTGMEDLSARMPMQSQSISTSECDKFAHSTISLLVKSENIDVLCHIPFWISEDEFVQSKDFESHGLDEESVKGISGGKNSKFLTVTLQSRSSELHVRGSNLLFKINVEKATGSVGLCESGSVQSWPFFHLFQLGTEIQICEYEKGSIGISVDVNCEAFDVWLSQQVFYFWHGIEFEVAEADHSEIPYGRMDLKLQLNKASLLLTDWICNGPLIELLMMNLRITTMIVKNTIEFSSNGDLHVNYNNIHKVLWEPFLEPWSFQVIMVRNYGKNASLDNGIITDVHLESTNQLNINITKSMCEVLLRAIEMIKEARGLVQMYEAPKSQRYGNLQSVENLCVRRYASYTIHNMTSLPFIFHVYQGLGNAENVDLSSSAYKNTVLPGISIPIYVDETLEEQAFSYRPASTSEGLGKKLSNKAGHHFMTIQFEGTSERSEPISMDLVGLTYFEVNFSNDYRKADADNGLLVPVVFDVSLQRYSKLIKLYSTVIFKNSTSLPLELRFDIPFGMSSKVLDPIYPGKEFPLPLHLAEAGYMRWRPLGNNYLWSEVHNLSMILSTENRSGFLRSLSCNPSHPSNYLFRCCLSVQDMSLSLSGRLRRRSPYLNGSLKQSVTAAKTRFIHRVTLTTPLTVKNYLPHAISVTVEGGGSTQIAVVKEVEASFFHVDSSHDLAVTFNVSGYGPASVKFPRAEIFSAAAKPNGAILSLTETMTLSGDLCDGSVHATVEKILDSLSGARELCVSVPYLLYNCTGFALVVSIPDDKLKGNYLIIPTCYDSIERGFFIDRKDGLHLLPSEDKPNSTAFDFYNTSYLSKNHILTSKELVTPPSGLFLTQSSVSHDAMYRHQSIDKLDLQEASLNKLNKQLDTYQQSDIKISNVSSNECLKAKPVMYSPAPSVVASDIMVRLGRYHAECPVQNIPSSSWSNPFFLVAPSGSTAVLVPQPPTTSAAVISVTSYLLDMPLLGRTRAITFQPRYVISNACSKPLCYKQKGTDFVFHLGVGKHSHLHWIDTTRELLIAVRFDEPGWQWSGCFLPNHLGDTQVKMRNYVSGALNIIRIEVQNAEIIQDEKIIYNAIGKSGTNFILLSDDDTSFVPYRIDNFSKETLRIYQQKCETLETIVHPYTSCPYAWDEPLYPHRLIVEIPGKRTLGSYTLDDVKESSPVHWASSSMSLGKHENTLFSSVHAEGAMKVLSIIDSTCHDLEDLRSPSSIFSGKKKETEDGVEMSLHYNEKVSIQMSFIGISLIDSYEELLYASAKDIRVEFLQNMERQIFYFQISSLQIDNQLRGTPYPVVLSFDEDFKGSLVNHVRNKEGGTKTKIESMMSYAVGVSSEPKICLKVSKWRNKETMLVSFEYIILRIGNLCLELDLELLLKLLEFFKATPLFNSDTPTSVSTYDDVCKLGIVDRSFSFAPQNSENFSGNGDHQFSRTECYTNFSTLPVVTPIGAPWQKIFLLARRQNKIYVEALSLAPVKMTLSFSSNPWMLRTGGLSTSESLIHRGIMALADVEGAHICLKELTITHQMASWESIQEILLKHYSRQFLHEMYKVFGSAGVIGNPMGFARRVGHGVKDFLSVPAKGVLQSPSGLISDIAQGTNSLLSNTLYAISDTATQFSKAAHKGIIAFTFDKHDASKMEQQRMIAYSQSKGVINELLEGLTGLLQSPIQGAEKHGLLGVLPGIALGVTGLVAKPAASVFEATGRTAQSIRNRSRLHRMGLHHLRVRLPRFLSAELPLRPYSWEEAIGSAVLLDVDGSKFKDEVLVMCKPVNVAGSFVVLTEKLILIIECSSLVHLGKPEFQGIVAEPEWRLLVEISLKSVIHVNVDGGIVYIVGSNSKTPIGQNQHHQRRTEDRMKQWSKLQPQLPFFQTNIEFASEQEAEYFLRVLRSTIEQGKEQGWGNEYLLHQSNLKM
ncbi:uncharacterized protein LOC130810577 isoform X2 [Amaranthus tricolor]|uniref:uncharacterized protein LOC130810577 isoform X2 n=1 Tax=Amaranthus tricolor TaxID=29722 RepID=UPI002585B3DC|nr:uncharacterized protein LOC130810577 isoform X2 [Amaranthus tricolor]